MSHSNDHHAGAGEGHQQDHHLHVTPFAPMLIVFIVLLALTALTVYTANLHHIDVGNTRIEISGTAHILIALTIAVVKSALVLGFFMHLLYDKAVNTIVLASSLFAISLFLGLTLMDLAVRDSIEPYEAGELTPGGTKQVIRQSILRDEAGHGNAHEGEDHSADDNADDGHADEDHATDDQANDM